MTSIDLDPALAMYLEDERLALMLQNSEFLQELRGDRMFMLTLERGEKQEYMHIRFSTSSSRSMSFRVYCDQDRFVKVKNVCKFSFPSDLSNV